MTKLPIEMVDKEADKILLNTKDKIPRGVKMEAMMKAYGYGDVKVNVIEPGTEICHITGSDGKMFRMRFKDVFSLKPAEYLPLLLKPKQLVTVLSIGKAIKNAYSKPRRLPWSVAIDTAYEFVR